MPLTLRKEKFEIFFFLFCLLFFIGFRLLFWYPVFLDRIALVEPDDSYAYILQAAQIDNCFSRDCPAMVDFSQQMTVPTNNGVAAKARVRQYARTLELRHPFHSLIVYALRKATGFSWDKTYKLIEFVGFILLSTAVGYFLYAIWGPGSAGITLLIISFTLLPGHGLQKIVPNTFTLGIALAVWGAMARGIKHPLIVLIAVVAMITMHPIGLVYSFMTLALYGLWSGWPLSEKNIFTLVIGIGLLGGAIILSLFPTSPPLSITPWPGYSTSNIFPAIMANISVGYGLLRSWVNNYDGRFVASLVVVLGFLVAQKKRRYLIITTLIVLAGLVAVASFHPYSVAPGMTLSRLWSPFSIFLTGAVGSLTWYLILQAIQWVSQINKPQLVLESDVPKKLTPRDWILAANIAIGLLLAQSFLGIAYNGVTLIKKYAQSSINDEDLYLSGQQSKVILKSTTPKDMILYNKEAVLYFHLINGTLQRRAVYYPAVAGTAEEKKWINDNAALRYFAVKHPTREGYFRISGNNPVEVFLPGGAAMNSLSLSAFAGAGKSLILTPLGPDGSPAGESLTVVLPTNGWIKINDPKDRKIERLLISVPNGAPFVRMTGFRVGESSLNWPWDSGVSFLAKKNRAGSPARPPKAIRFETSRIDPVGLWPVKIIDDSGASVFGAYLR